MARKALQTQVDELAELHARLAAICGRLASHAEVVALAVRSPEAVPRDDLDAAIGGLHELHAELLRA